MTLPFFLEAISKMPNSSFNKLMTLSEIEGPISAPVLNRDPQNINIYSSGHDSTPFLTSDYFSIFEITSKNWEYQNMRAKIWVATAIVP